jgi:hypothetical protein
VAHKPWVSSPSEPRRRAGAATRVVTSLIARVVAEVVPERVATAHERESNHERDQEEYERSRAHRNATLHDHSVVRL